MRGNQVQRRKAFVFAAALLMAAGSAGTGMAAPVFIIKVLHLGPVVLGTMAAVIQIFTIGTTGFFGRLSDRIGHRALPIVSGIALFGVFSLLPMAARPMHLYLIGAAVGLCLAAFWPSLEASTGEALHGRKLLRALGAFNLSWGLGVSVGPQLAGVIYDRFAAGVFYVMGLLSAAAGIAIALSPKGELPPAQDGGTTLERLCSPAPHYLYLGWIANFGSWFSVGVLRNIFPTLALPLKISPTGIGFVNLLSMGIMTAAFVILSLDTWWNYRAWPLIIGQLIGAAGLLTVFRADSLPFFALGFALAGLSGGITYSSSLFYSMDGHEDKGAKGGMHEVVLGTGALIGPFIGGWLAQGISIRAPYLLCAGVILACIAIELGLLRSHRLRGVPSTS